MTKKTISTTGTLLIALIVAILLPASAAAVPQPPHVFQGAVTVGGSTAADGLTITAAITGASFPYTPTTQTSGGRYGDDLKFKVPSDDPDTTAKEGGVSGDTIVFYVEGVEAGTYTFEVGDVTQLNLSISALPTPSAPPGAGGVGGGGLAGVTSVLYSVNQTGAFTEDVIAESADGKVTLFIAKGTIGLNRLGSLLSSISIKEMGDPPDPPVYFKIIPPVYQIGPDGATFEPPIDLTIMYDATLIPERVAEKNLVVATFDTSTRQWVRLESTVNPESDTIKAKVSHFSAFAVLAPIRPASFTVTDLSITPTEVYVGESIIISVHVTNTGDLTSSYEVSLKIDNTVVQTKEVTLDGGDSETASFSVTPDAVSEYSVNISGLLGTFEVKEFKAPAAFTARALTISPAEANTGDRVTISVIVTNTGDLTGTHKVTLKIDGVVVETKEIILTRGGSQKVVFTTVKHTEGTYTVDVDGLRGSFVVKEKAPPVVKEKEAPTPFVPKKPPELPPIPPINWWLLSGIIVAVIILGVTTWFVLARHRG